MGPPNRPPGPAAVLLDFEGVLVRHEVDIEEVRIRLAGLFGPLGVTRPFRPILRRIREAVAEVAGGGSGKPADPSLDLLQRAYAIVDEFELAGAARAKPKPGAADLIAALAARRIPIALYTERGRACVAPSLTAAGIDPARFAAVGAREDSYPIGPIRPVDPNAPWANAPDYTPAVLAAAQALAAADIWLVGDHPDDVKAGRAAASQIPGLMVRTALLKGASPAPAGGAAPDQTLSALDEILALPGVAA